MSDHFEAALEWFQEFRHEQLTQEVRIGYTEEAARLLFATVPSNETNTTQDGLNQSIQFFKFIFRRCDLVDKQIKINRGLKIWWNKSEYTIALADRKLLYYYNDTLKNDVVIQTVLSGEEDDIG